MTDRKIPGQNELKPGSNTDGFTYLEGLDWYIPKNEKREEKEDEGTNGISKLFVEINSHLMND